MEKFVIVDVPSPARGNLRIYGFRFGSGRPSVAVISGFRGDEITQLYSISQIVSFLKEKQQENPYFIKGSILIIPAVNIFGFNTGKRYFPEGTDIGKLFPGYTKGELAQRIAGGIFEHIKNVDYGIEVVAGEKSYDYVPHVKPLDVEESYLGEGVDFGLRYIYPVKEDLCNTTSLAYNWYRLGTKAFTILGGKTDILDSNVSTIIKNSIITFLSKKGVIDFPLKEEEKRYTFISEEMLTYIPSKKGGFFISCKKAGDFVKKGELIFTIMDPLTGDNLYEEFSPKDGYIFRLFSKNLISQGETACIIL